MQYQSTRDKTQKVSASRAILQGLSVEGGLFVPEQLPKFSEQHLEKMVSQDYIRRAQKILEEFLSDFSNEEIESCLKGAYDAKKFSGSQIAPLSKLGENAYLLELWHGPTCAFKDMALQLLPRLMTVSMQKSGDGKEIVILVATSGDTGKAALEGFCNVPGIRIVVFYPEEGVSPLQKLQMATQEGENVFVAAIQGNFDDAQSGVKKLFCDPQIATALQKQNRVFSSANSINWGRLLPQIVYYVSAYCDLVRDEQIALGDPINVCVPTGNFGNILAAYYAKMMGVPLGKLICASNINKVLTDFIRTGVYNRNRQFYPTASPSMDILISSNLERLLYLLTGEDDAQIREWFTALAEQGTYEVTDAVKAKLTEQFYGGFCDDAETKATIAELYKKYGYTCDTHTAVAVKVYEDYRKETGDTTKTLIASTASPFKFSASVLDALGKKPADDVDEYDMVELLHEASKMEIPQSLAALKTKPRRFEGSIDKSEMQQFVLQELHLS